MDVRGELVAGGGGGNIRCGMLPNGCLGFVLGGGMLGVGSSGIGVGGGRSGVGYWG